MRYSLSVEEIKRSNDIFDPEDLSPGINLYLPIPTQIKPKPLKTDIKSPQVRVKFSWPSQGTLSSGFGMRHGRMHEGIDITKDNGRDIRVAGIGVVEFAGNKSGYGKTIIINHGSGFKTLYAHNQKIYVKKGTKVNTGVIIATMGSSGNSSGIHLHFEVHYKDRPQNPLRYLPVR
jgi:murein DD-endopeptidase MepM/ murein hydrolase activator NlpD